jgi:pantetheine-phosphate adenylyltransferase
LTAVYPGTFDPMTMGHQDLTRRASRLFPRLILAVAAGHTSARCSRPRSGSTSPRSLRPYPNVEVVAFEGLLRDFVVANGGKVVVRGLRAVSDFEYEFQMAGMNRPADARRRDAVPDAVRPVPVRQRHLRARDCRPGGDVSKFVAPLVLERLKERVARPRDTE